jgi:transient receptor potential cation channel subfamily M protein 3
MDDSQCHVETSFTLFSQQPFNELLMWSVLTKRQDMAKLMWHHGEEALAKALIASKLYRAMASEAADDDLEVEIYDELRSYAAEFDREALELLDYCYRQDDDLAMQLLTCELSNWSRQTCLRLAFACHHRELLAHPCAQLILGDLWLGGLRTRRSTNLKIVLAILCPPLILRLEFKSKEELQLMPQTEEEHMIDLKDEGRDNNTSSDHSSSNSSSASSSPSSSPKSERSASAKSRRISMTEGVEMNAGSGNGSGVHLRQRLHSGSSAALAASTIPIIEKDELNEENNTSKEQIVYEVVDPGVIYERRRMRQLRIKRKFYEFYAAPITKFWSWSMAYFFFLIVYTYTMLIRTPLTPEWNEYYVILHMASFGGEKVREIMASEPVKLSHKISVWASGVWNCCDAVFVIEFFVAMVFRLQEDTLEIGRVLYCLNIVFWYVM